jgi:hypothetical protein
MLRSGVRLACLLAMPTLALALAVSSPAQAAGVKISQIVAANPENCTINSGIGFDGTNLILDCWHSNILDFVHPTDGALDHTLTVPAATDLRAMA